MRARSAIFLLVFALISREAKAQPGHTEDFTTNIFKDPAETTADWNTTDGELKLYPFTTSGIASFDTPGSAQDVAVHGNYCYVADDTEGLQVLDVSDPGNPVLVGGLNTVQAFGITVVDNTVYLADSGAGLKIIDVTDPSSPVLLGSIDTPRFALDVVVEGNLAFVANENTGLLVFDVSDRSAPVQIGSYDTPNNARGVDVDGNLCYVADRGQGGLVVLDVTDPANPTLLSNVLTGGDVWGVQADGDRLYLANTGAGLAIYDVSDPSNPTPVGSLDSVTCRDVDVQGNVAVIAGRTFVYVADVSDPANPVLIDTYDNPGLNSRLVVDGEYAYVATGPDVGVEIVEFRDVVPSPSLRAFVNLTSTAQNIEIVGHRAYVNLGDGGVLVEDLTDPLQPTPIAVVATATSVVDVTADGNVVFLAEGAFGLRILEVSDSGATSFLGLESPPGGAYGIDVQGDLAFVAAGTGGMKVYRIDDLNNPVLIGSYPVSGTSVGVKVHDQFAYVQTTGTEFRILDVSDPTFPIGASAIFFGNVTDFTVSGDHLYMAFGPAKLFTWDVSDPNSVSFIGAAGGSGSKVAVSGDYAFFAGDEMSVIDFSDPENPIELGRTSLPAGDPGGLAVAGEYVFVAHEGTGLRVHRAFQRDVFTGPNRGQSLNLNPTSGTIPRARVTASQIGDVRWLVTAAGPLDFQPITPNEGTWSRLQTSGNEFRWSTKHDWSAPGVNPRVLDATFEWLYEAAVIDAVADVPDDQGGRVRLSFTRSGYDFADETDSPIAGYNVYRQVDGEAAKAATAPVSVTGDASTRNPDGDPAFAPVGASLLRADDTTLYRNGSFPPGTWVLVASAFATQTDNYVFEVRTERDRTAVDPALATFLVTAHTTAPSIWFSSEPLSGYSVDNLAPGIPQNMSAAYHTGSGNTLDWDDAPEEDFQYYRVYRSTDPSFTPAPQDLVHETVDSGWVDPDFDGEGVFYRVTALDHAGNESDPAEPGTVTAIGSPRSPNRFTLGQNQPNPFNPRTTISYEVGRAGPVKIAVYDVAGRLVRTLVDEFQDSGRHEARWDGRGEHGSRVASGSYYYRLVAPGFTQTRKMVLVQ